MIDAHTHLENGDLSIEYVHKFIDAAKEKGITGISAMKKADLVAALTK